MASNDTTIADEDGDFEDWIELFNYGSSTISLQGFGLTDNPNQPFKWTFPNVQLSPGGFLLVWASGKNRTSGAALHTNFRIAAAGEPLLLTAPSGVLVDSLSEVALQTDVSYGRQPDGVGSLVYFYDPTPNATNNTQPLQALLEAPVFSSPSGFYSSNVLLIITHPDPTVTLVYTTDGSEPELENIGGKTYPYKNQYRQSSIAQASPILTDTIFSHSYTGPLVIGDSLNAPNRVASKSITWHQNPPYIKTSPIKKGTVVRARAFKQGFGGPITTATFFVNQQNVFDTDLPVISISASADDLFDYHDGNMVAGVDFDIWRNSSSGGAVASTPSNYRRTGRETEKPVHFEYFKNQQLEFSQRVGLRLHGGNARSFYPKSFRLYARNTYSENAMDYQFFDDLPYQSFSRLLFRNSGQDYMNTYLRDAFTHESVKHLAFDKQAYQPTTMYLNGEYWGIINMRERIDHHYINRKYGVEEEDLDLLFNAGRVMNGDSLQFVAVRNWFENADFSNDSTLEEAKTKIDLDNFTDYYITQIFINNTDWPGTNIRYFRKRVPYTPSAPKGHDGLWRWIFFDADFAFGRVGNATFNTLEFATATTQSNWSNYHEATVVLRQLLSNETYGYQFINRFADLMNTAFLPARMHALLDTISQTIENEIPQHSSRWSIMQNWTGQLQTVRSFISSRPDLQRGHLQQYFQLADTLLVQLDVNGNGHIKINTIDIEINTPGVGATPYPWSGVYFENVPITLEAKAAAGYQFSHWSGGASGSNPVVTITPQSAFATTAHFVPAPSHDELLYFWLMDDDIPNDTPLEFLEATYSSSGPIAEITFVSSLSGYPFDPAHPNWRKASMERRNQPTSLNYNELANNNIPYNVSNMRGLQVRAPFATPTGENAMHFTIPTIGHKDIQLKMAVLREGLPHGVSIAYWDTAAAMWSTVALQQPTQTIDSTYQLLAWDFSPIAIATNNPDFRLLLTFESHFPLVDDDSRVTFNNISVLGNKLPGFSSPQLDAVPLVQVMPNPATHNIRIESHESIEHVKVVDSQGRILVEEIYNSSLTQQTIDISHLPNGPFTLMVTGATYTKHLRIIKAG